MITANPNPAAHAGEAQASAAFAARESHWANLAIQLLAAARTLADDHLQRERDDVRACKDAAHHRAILNFCRAVKNADHAGVEKACAEFLAADAAGQAPARDPRVADMFETGGAA